MNDQQLKSLDQNGTPQLKSVDDLLYFRVVSSGRSYWCVRYTLPGKKSAHKSISDVTARATSEYLFPSRKQNSKKPYISSDTLNHALAKMFGMKVDSRKNNYEDHLGKAGIIHFVIHDLRRTARSMGLNDKEMPVGPISTAVIQGLLRQYGGFYVYKISVIVANMVSRAILGTGLKFATNAAITRSVGTFLGPIGWIATGLWLAVDLAGPAYRKTVPAVVHIALLRTMLLNRITIGVVGDGSSGKDSLIKAVFGLDAEINPIAGSTSKAESFPLNEKGNAVIVNYPGFNDYRPEVEAYTDAYLHHTDVFVMVVDISRGVSKTDIDILNKVKSHRKPVLVCLNKVDLPRTPADLANLEKAAHDRLTGCDFIKTAFDPDTRLHQKPIGCDEVYAWIKGKVKSTGKNIDSGNFPTPPES